MEQSYKEGTVVDLTSRLKKLVDRQENVSGPYCLSANNENSYTLIYF